MESFTVMLVPLDDRPCCTQFPQRIGDVAGIRLLMPPRRLLGRFTTPGDCDAIAQWMRQNAGAVHGIVVAVDQLAYGGLVASRSAERDEQSCLDALNVLEEIKRAHPHLVIYAASVLMRISITYKNAAYLQYGNDIFRYSQLYDQVHRLGQTELGSELRTVESRIPAELLREYWRVRRRNHAVNKRMIELAATGVVDWLSITQEDTSPVGVHVPEQQELMKTAYELHAQHKVLLYPGADEGTQTLLARMIQHAAKTRLRMYPRYATVSGRMAVAPFEDRPIEETVKAHIYAAGAIAVDHPETADIWLFVNTPVHGVNTPYDTGGYFHSRHLYWDVAEGIHDALSHGRQVALADAALANASDPELMQCLLRQGTYWRLLSYAGWNTAGNTLGTSISHAIARWHALHVDFASPERDSERDLCHYAFMLERLMDEYVYQARVRREVNEWVRRELGLSDTYLDAGYDQVNDRVKRLLNQQFAALRPFLPKRPPAAIRANAHHPLPLEFSITNIVLPWNRTFEVRVDAECRMVAEDAGAR